MNIKIRHIFAICISFFFSEINAENNNFTKGLHYLQQFDLDSASFYLKASKKDLVVDANKLLECEIYLITISALRLQIPGALKALRVFEEENKSILKNNSDLSILFEANKGITYALANRLEESVALLSMAWESKAAVVRENSLIPGFLAYNIHLIHNLDSAQIWYERYKELVERKYGKNSTAMGVYYAYLGANYQYIGEWILAETYLEKAIDLARASNNPKYFLPLFLRWQATFFMNKSEIISEANQKKILLEKAFENCQLCAQYAKGYPYKLAHCYTMMGRSSHYFGHNDVADEYFEKAVAQIKIAMPFANGELINIYGEYAKFLKNAGMLDKANTKLENGIQEEEEVARQNVYPHLSMTSELYFEMAAINFQQGNLTTSLKNIQIGLLLHNHKPKDSANNLNEPSIQNIAKYREALEYQSLKIKILYQLYLSDPTKYLLYLVNNGKIFDQLFYEVYDQLSYDWSKHSLQNVVYSTYSIMIDVLFDQYSLKKQNSYFNQAIKYSEKTRAIRLREKKFGEDPAGIKEVFDKINQINPKQLPHVQSNWVEYFWGDKYVYAFVGNQDELQFKRLDYSANLYGLINEYMTSTTNFPKYLLKSPLEYKAYYSNYVQLSQALYDRLISPLNFLTDEFTIVPQDILQSLSFQSLVMDIDSLEFTKGWDLNYLGKKYTISYMPTITYNPEILPTNHLVKVFQGNYQAKFLRNSTPESRKIKKNYKSSVFDLHHLFQENGNIPSVTHIIAHTEIDSAGEANLWLDDNHSARFPPDSINLQCNLLILATCESNVGNIDQGEGLMSLSYNCMNLGARSVISSLWKINDVSTSDIILSTYAQSAENSIPKALMTAQVLYLEKAPSYFKHPYFWASFQYHGNPNNQLAIHKIFRVSLKSICWVYFLLAALGLMLAYVLFRKYNLVK